MQCVVVAVVVVDCVGGGGGGADDGGALFSFSLFLSHPLWIASCFILAVL